MLATLTIGRILLQLCIASSFGLYAAVLVQAGVLADKPHSRADSLVRLSNSESWRIPKNCGPNSLYAYLKLHGCDGSMRQILNLATPDEKGTSMQTLCDAANQLGVPSKIVEMPRLEAGNIKMPVIAHLSGTRLGHFVVVLRVNADRIVTADLVNCTIQEESISAFKRNWSGFLLVPKQTVLGIENILLATAGALCLCVGICFHWSRRQSPKKV